MLLIPYRALLLHLKSIALATQKHCSYNSGTLPLRLWSMTFATQDIDEYEAKGSAGTKENRGDTILRDFLIMVVASVLQTKQL